MSIQSIAKQSLVRAAMSAERLLRGRARRGEATPATARCFLFLQYMMPLGYCVHDTPIYEALRACAPDAEIAVATRGPGYDTLRYNPFINHLLATADPLTDLGKATRELRSKLQTKQSVPAIGVTNSSNVRTRITLLNVLAGNHLRLGHTLAPGLYHQAQAYDPRLSLIDNNLRIVEKFGCARGHREPRVFFSQACADAARALLHEAGCTNGRPVVVLVTQTSGGQRTGWRLDRFVEIIRYVTETLSFHAVFVGTEADVPAIETLRAAAGRGPAAVGVSLAGRTSIPELAALLAMSDYAISLDTGTMHVGRAAGVPMVVLGPSWQKPLEWLPLGRERVRVLRGEDRVGVPEGYQLDEIEVPAVTAALAELMALYPASEHERALRVQSSLSAVDHGPA